MGNRGITLIELIIVIAIIGILVIALGFSFQGWVEGYRVESQIKEMYVDLMNTRARAMQRNRLHRIDFPSVTEYRILEDTNEDGVPDTALPTFPKTVQYDLSRAGGAITSLTIDFDTRGIIKPTTTFGTTLCMSTTTNPDYDCIVISRTRINMGKLITSIPNGGACNSSNCVAK